MLIAQPQVAQAFLTYMWLYLASTRSKRHTYTWADLLFSEHHVKGAGFAFWYGLVQLSLERSSSRWKGYYFRTVWEIDESLPTKSIPYLKPSFLKVSSVHVESPPSLVCLSLAPSSKMSVWLLPKESDFQLESRLSITCNPPCSQHLQWHVLSWWL